MREEPRVGDVIFDARSMTPYNVATVETEHAVAARWDHRTRRFRLRDLDVVDHDAGLWQEMTR